MQVIVQPTLIPAIAHDCPHNCANLMITYVASKIAADLIQEITDKHKIN